LHEYPGPILDHVFEKKRVGKIPDVSIPLGFRGGEP
jgi:hypothetical protein